MNFLELVNRLKMEAGASGPQLTTLGGSLSMESLRLKTWINEAWLEVQRHKDDWKWMQRNFSGQTIVGQQGYTPTDAAPTGWGITNFRNWKRDSFRLYSTAIGTPDEQILGFLDYVTFRNLYIFGNQRTTQQRPAVFTIAPDKSILFGAVPNDVFTCVGEYWITPYNLAADTDTPTLPEPFHMLLVWRALMNYGEYEAAPEVLRRAERNLKTMQSRLETDQMPEVTFGPPLA